MKFLFKSQGVNAPCDFFVGVALRAGQCIPTPRRAKRDTPPQRGTLFRGGMWLVALDKGALVCGVK